MQNLQEAKNNIIKILLRLSTTWFRVVVSCKFRVFWAR